MSEKNSSSMLFDPKVRSLAFQVFVGIVVLVALVLGFNNMLQNYGGLDISFMKKEAGIKILTTFGTWLAAYDSTSSSYFTAFLVGVYNTIIVAVIGIVLATIWGFILGVFRLSDNFVLRSFSTIYVELLRNVPLLLQIFFWMAMTRTISDTMKVAESVTIIPGVMYYNASGLWGPFLDWQQGGLMVFIAAVVGAIAWWAISRWAKKRQMATGQTFPAFWVGLALFILIPLVVFYIMGRPVIVELPTEVVEGPLLKRGAFENGVGSVVPPNMIALTAALSLYTAAFIAEIVRAGILAVPKGQNEASAALGLSKNQALRLIVLPQALRVIIPPLASQYLNLTKNSSLAAAIGYPEITSLFAGTILNQTGRAVEIILISIGVYLTMSLLTSLFMNWFNSRMKLVER